MIAPLDAPLKSRRPWDELGMLCYKPAEGIFCLVHATFNTLPLGIGLRAAAWPAAMVDDFLVCTQNEGIKLGHGVILRLSRDRGFAVLRSEWGR